MSPLTDDEHGYYESCLRDAQSIVKSLLEFGPEASLSSADDLFVTAVFEKIASPLHFLRQEQRPRGPDMIDSTTGKDIYFDKTPKKPSRIFGEGTQWKQKTSPWGQPQEWSRQDYLVDQAHKDILQDLIKQLEGQPDAKVEEPYNGYIYWANPSKDGRWYLNRRRQP